MRRVSASTSPARWKKSPASGDSEIDQPVANGEPDQRRDVAHLGLRHQAAAISVDRRRQYPEQARDLLAGAALDHELEDLDFTRAQAFQRGRNHLIYQKNRAHGVHAARAAPRLLSPFGAKLLPPIPDYS